ncbi:MAG: hypothetical protein PSX80_06795 [bacterium]|nr:hypothetical protein [bacterium]
MTFLEAIIIYLSVGAPFGVLVFFSRRPVSSATAFLYALTATAAWPVFGTYRLYRGRFRQSPGRSEYDLDRTPLEVLTRVSREVPVEAAEIFEVAGHSNPWIATNCYARARKRVIDSHIVRLSRLSTSEPRSRVSANEDALLPERLTANVGT